MTTVRTQTWPGSATVSTDAALTLAVRRAALWGLVLARLIAGWGVQWDIQWHVRIGRDSFWIAPHVMTYAGVAATVLLSFGVLAWDTWRRRRTAVASDEITVMRIVGTPGFHLSAWGIALTVLAAPIDDLWHRLFGIDVTLWSPPHLLGLFGHVVSSAAGLLIAGEVYPHARRLRATAIVVNGAIVLGALSIAVQPALRLAFLHGGLAFHLYAILGAVLFPLVYVAAARLSGMRTSPLAVLVLALVIGIIGVQISRVGFEILQPVSVIEAEIAKDPTSPIAVSNAIARTNGEPPGTRSLWVQLRSLLPVLAMVLVDPRRRPAAATVVYGVGLLLSVAWTLAHSPAFAPMVPDLGLTLVALALTVGAAFAAGVAGRWLSRALSA